MSELPAEVLITPTTARMTGRHAPSPDAAPADLASVLDWLRTGDAPAFSVPERALLDQQGLGPADDAMWHFTVGRQMARAGHVAAAARHFESAAQRWPTNVAIAAAARDMERPPPAVLDGPFDPVTCRFAELWPGAARIMQPFTGIGQPIPGRGIADFIQRIGEARDLEDALDAVGAAVNYAASLSTRARLLRQASEWLRAAGHAERAQQWARWAAAVPP